MKRFIDTWYHRLLYVLGFPEDLHFTDFLREVAKRNPILYIIVGLPIFIWWVATLLKAKCKWGWIVLGILIFLFTVWLMLHIGRYW